MCNSQFKNMRIRLLLENICHRSDQGFHPRTGLLTNQARQHQSCGCPIHYWLQLGASGRVESGLRTATQQEHPFLASRRLVRSTRGSQASDFEDRWQQIPGLLWNSSAMIGSLFLQLDRYLIEKVHRRTQGLKLKDAARGIQANQIARQL